jgi:hypothetical protein
MLDTQAEQIPEKFLESFENFRQRLKTIFKIMMFLRWGMLYVKVFSPPFPFLKENLLKIISRCEQLIIQKIKQILTNKFCHFF